MTGDKSVTANYVPRPLPACEQCHGTPPHPGLDGVGDTSDDAPEVMGDGTSASGAGGTPKPFDDGTYGYNVNGHGANGTAPQGSPIRPNVPCTGCHDVSQPATGNGRHLNGIVSSAKQGLNRSENTAHLIAAFIGGSSPTYSVQLTFDNACYTRCHAGARRADMRHSFVDPGDQYPPGVMVLGTHSTIEDGESLLWPVDSDLSTNASTSLPAFGTCVSCHNPHGTNAQPPTTPYYPSNYMVRANWPAPLCVVVCHN
jgi:hypothetical protein